MTNEAIEKLKGRIANIKLEDDDDLCIYIQYASRMASLGDRSEFEKIHQITEQPLFKGRFDDILIDRCRTVLWDINEQMGEELAFTIIDAQDLWCFYQYAKDGNFFSQGVHHWFETIMAQTSIVPIDEETADILTQFLETWPLAEKDLLAPIAAPVTVLDSEILSRISQQFSPLEITGHWASPSMSNGGTVTNIAYAKPAQMPGFILACDGGEPSEQLLRSQDQLFWQGQTPIGQIRVVRQLNSYWKLVLSITKPDGTFVAVDTVRTGFFGAVRDHGKPSRWIYNLKPFDRDFRNILLWDPIIIRLSQGIVLKLSLE